MKDESTWRHGKSQKKAVLPRSATATPKCKGTRPLCLQLDSFGLRGRWVRRVPNGLRPKGRVVQRPRRPQGDVQLDPELEQGRPGDEDRQAVRQHQRDDRAKAGTRYESPQDGEDDGSGGVHGSDRVCATVGHAVGGRRQLGADTGVGTRFGEQGERAFTSASH
jgi:hypothetical protein